MRRCVQFEPLQRAWSETGERRGPGVCGLHVVPLRRISLCPGERHRSPHVQRALAERCLRQIADDSVGHSGIEWVCSYEHLIPANHHLDALFEPGKNLPNGSPKADLAPPALNKQSTAFRDHVVVLPERLDDAVIGKSLPKVDPSPST